MKKYRWNYGPFDLDCPQAEKLAKEAGVGTVAAAVALNRGLSSPGELKEFIEKNIDGFQDPFMMKDMQSAQETILKAVKQNKKITVYGDYDVDGITATALLVSCLRHLGADVDFYIPDRIREGYGMNLEAVKRLAEQGTQLLITVDTGITAIEEVAWAEENGVCVVVTDHHHCQKEVPVCHAVVNPMQEDCMYPFPFLAGVGVVFKLVCALLKEEPREVLRRWGDIVALGTVADVVSLRGENRLLVEYGLRRLEKTENVGLQELLSVCNLKGKRLDAVAIGFQLAPRINAAGRIGNARKAVELLLATSAAQARTIAVGLDLQNQDRKNTESEIYEEVLDKIQNDPSAKEKRVLVVYGSGWHHGVIGIVASRICEKYAKPCILITCEDGMGKGSGRSVKGFHLFDALSYAGSLCEKYGGHELAAGLSIRQENIPLLDEKLNEYAQEHMEMQALFPSMDVDFDLRQQDFTEQTVMELERFEPFGCENPMPMFGLRSCQLLTKRLLSDGKHLRLMLQKGSCRVEAIGFQMGPLGYALEEGDQLDLLGTLSMNEWNGTRKVQMVLKDMEFTSLNRDSSPVPDRQDLNMVYLYIKKTGNGSVRENHSRLPLKLTQVTGRMYSEKKLHNCLRIMREMGLATYSWKEGYVEAKLLPSSGKVQLEKSKVWAGLKAQSMS